MKKYLVNFVAVASLATFGTAAFGQDESTNRVAAKTDWSVFVESDPTSCWAVSSPSETVNTKDGRVVAVRRSDILLFVSYIPGEAAKGQISFTGGYPFAPGSQVALEIGGQTFQLFTDAATNKEMAWAPSEADDTKIVTAMKRGAEAVLTAKSAKGTTTKDTFSLLGFTAALSEAENRCSG
ncbi:MAG: invasion associated locus B family protein [Paracoccaceae bacterium]